MVAKKTLKKQQQQQSNGKDLPVTEGEKSLILVFYNYRETLGHITKVLNNCKLMKRRNLGSDW